MNPKIIYPIPIRQNHIYRYLRNTCRILFILSSIICLIINYLTKGKAWSLIVVWSLIMTWFTFFSLNLVEFSFYNHLIRLLISTIILLGLIDYFLAPGFAEIVIPIVIFVMLLVMMIIFYITYDKKEKHIMPIFILGFLSIISFLLYSHSNNTLVKYFQIASFILFLILVLVNRKEIIRVLTIKFKNR